MLTSEFVAKPPLPSLSSFDRNGSPRYREDSHFKGMWNGIISNLFTRILHLDDSKQFEDSTSLLSKSKNSLSFARFGNNNIQFSKVSKRIVFLHKDRQAEGSENYRIIDNIPSKNGIGYRIDSSINDGGKYFN